MRGELRGLPRFNAAGWNQAARYWLAHGGDLEEAQRYSDRAVQMNENYATLTTRAMLLEKKGDAKGAAEARSKALAVATEADLNQQGYALLGEQEGRRGDRAVREERRRAPRVVERPRQPRRGAAGQGQQEGRRRELRPRAGAGQGRAQQEANPEGPGSAQDRQVAGAISASTPVMRNDQPVSRMSEPLPPLPQLSEKTARWRRLAHPGVSPGEVRRLYCGAPA